jgi:hypothetical protein
MNYLIIFWLAILTWLILRPKPVEKIQERNSHYLLGKLNATILQLREKKVFFDDDLKEIDKMAKGEKILPVRLTDFLDLEDFNKK